MAVTKSVTTEHGIELQNAYIRIDEFSGTKHKVNIRVRTYKNAGAALDKQPIDDKSYSFEPDISGGASEILTQGYEYLKTTDDFADAVDC